MRKAILLFFVLLFFINNFSAQESAPNLLIEDLPAVENERISAGYAGMVGGVIDDVLIVGGGANFPTALPWEGGKKVWHDKLFVYKDGQWRLQQNRLPKKIAYASSVSIEEGVLIIGGETGEETLRKVYLLQYNATSNDLSVSEYPELPEPLAYSSAVVEDDYVYVIGGKNKQHSVNSFYRLNINDPTSWEKLPSFPGMPRALLSTAVQESQFSRKLFVFGGRNQQKDKQSEFPEEVLAYDLEKGTWENLGPIVINGKKLVLMGATATSLGSMHVLIYGGSDEKLFSELEEIGLLLQSSQTDSTQRLVNRQHDILNHHPGFSKDILAYNTITGKWFVHQSMEKPLPVTALSFPYKDHYVIVSGESSPGIRTPEVRSINILTKQNRFGLVNYAVLIAYLLISLVIGIYFSYKQKSTTDYFKGGGRIPWWAAGLSVFGTLLSAITFMAIPAKAFITDWSYFMLNIAAIVITPVIAYLFIPYFNRLNISTAYEFLENRFNYLARAFGSLSFILFQLGRIGIVLLLPSLAISIVTGMPVITSILIMGLLCIIYTAFGGIEAVVWTDVLQVVVLMGGSLLAVIWIFAHTEASLPEMVSYANDKQKLNIMDMRFNFTEATFWVVFIGGLASAMVSQGTDQTIVQRYLTSKSVKDSQKTLYTNAVLTLPATIIFFGLGTLLFIFYSEMPQKLSPTIANNDSIFPWYIVNELPTGVSGLLIAGIFSAAMSSISSSLNSVSTAFVTDFYKRFKTRVTDKHLLSIARIATIVTGIIGVLLAIWMANSNIKSLWDEFYRFLGLFTGGLGGMFLLGMLTKRANSVGTLLGLVCSAVLIYFVSTTTSIHILMYSLIGVVSCFLFGYLFSLLIPQKRAEHI